MTELRFEDVELELEEGDTLSLEEGTIYVDQPSMTYELGDDETVEINGLMLTGAELAQAVEDFNAVRLGFLEYVAV